MYECMYVYVCVCMYVYIRVSIYPSIHLSIGVSIILCLVTLPADTSPLCRPPGCF